MERNSERNYWNRFWTQRTSRRRQLQYMGVGGVGLVGAALVGCGDDDDDAPTATSAPGGPTTAPGSPTAVPTATPDPDAPRPGGRITTISPADFVHMDFHILSGVNSIGPANMFAQTLLRFTNASPISVEIEGYLASEWEQPEEDLFVLTVDPRAKWHDIAPVSGRAVDSEDIKASLDRILDPATKSANARQISDFVASVDTPDNGTVNINLAFPMAGLQNPLASVFLIMMPREGVHGDYNPKEVAIGSGPFVVETFQQNSGITFQKNPNYWKPGLPYADGIDHSVVADNAQAFNALITGNISMRNATYTELATLKARNPNAVITQFPNNRAQSLWMPDREGSPYKNLQLRQAIKYAINQDEMIQRVYNGSENAQFTGIITPVSPHIALPEAEAREIWGHDPVRARQLMEATGLGNVTLPVNISTLQGGQIMGDLVQVIASQLAPLGITLDIRDHDAVTGNNMVVFSTVKDYGAAFYVSAANSGGDDIDWLYKGYARNGFYNFTQDDVSVDSNLQALIQAMIREFDPEARLELAYDVQRYIGEVAISVPSPAGYHYHAHQQNVRGYVPHVAGMHNVNTRTFENIWFAS